MTVRETHGLMLLATLVIATTSTTVAQDGWRPVPALTPPNLADAQRGTEQNPNNRISIRQPGPDTADFPDSAFTVPPGDMYLETSINYQRPSGLPKHEYFTATLLRLGLFEGLELRINTPKPHCSGHHQRHGHWLRACYPWHQAALVGCRRIPSHPCCGRHRPDHRSHRLHSFSPGNLGAGRLSQPRPHVARGVRI
ncbi:hypothetical protein HRbin36_01710 [bacterium HR36]|nr:hypothetical protein HRbin36_01710 [bacterium HR36]